ncbi:MAG: Flp pilus assembly pilin Flp [Bacteriovoracaceae bacterium]|jgi:Flp pilus assembly pilin Flp
MNKLLNQELGQTVVEYVLLMFVMVIVIISGMGQVKEWFLANSDNCNGNSKSFVCKMDKTFNGTFNSYGSMRYFTIRQ